MAPLQGLDNNLAQVDAEGCLLYKHRSYYPSGGRFCSASQLSAVSQTLETCAQRASVGPFQGKMPSICFDFHYTFKKVIPEQTIGNAWEDLLLLLEHKVFILICTFCFTHSPIGLSSACSIMG